MVKSRCVGWDMCVRHISVSKTRCGDGLMEVPVTKVGIQEKRHLLLVRER